GRIARADHTPVFGAHDHPMLAVAALLGEEKTDGDAELVGKGAQISKRWKRDAALHLAQPAHRPSELFGKSGKGQAAGLAQRPYIACQEAQCLGLGVRARIGFCERRRLHEISLWNFMKRSDMKKSRKISHARYRRGGCRLSCRIPRMTNQAQGR